METRKVELKEVSCSIENFNTVKRMEALNGWKFLATIYTINDKQNHYYFERPIKEEKKEALPLLDGLMDYNNDSKIVECTINGKLGDTDYWEMVYDRMTSNGWGYLYSTPTKMIFFKLNEHEKKDPSIIKEKTCRRYSNGDTWSKIYKNMKDLGWEYIRSDGKFMHFERDQPKPFAFDTGVGTSCVGVKEECQAIEKLWLGNRRPEKENTDRPYNSNVNSERYWPKVHDLMTKQGWTYISTDACRMYFERDVKQESYIQKVECEAIERFRNDCLKVVEDLLKTLKNIEGKI